MAYRTIIFAPDAEGMLVEIPDKGTPTMGAQSLLPVPEPVLYDHRDTPIEKPKKSIGFRPR